MSNPIDNKNLRSEEITESSIRAWVSAGDLEYSGEFFEWFQSVLEKIRDTDQFEGLYRMPYSELEKGLKALQELERTYRSALLNDGTILSTLEDHATDDDGQQIKPTQA